MRKLKLAGLAVVALFAADHVCAEPMTCEINVSSKEGGRLEVTTYDYRQPTPQFPFDLPPIQMSWHPQASGPSIDLMVQYRGNTFKQITMPLGALARFMPTKGADDKKYTTIVSAEGMPPLHIDQTDVDVGPDQGDVVFGKDDSANKIMNTAIGNGKPIQIVILNADKTIASETFDVSATAGRDQLMAYARHLVETVDPRVCHAM